MARGRQEIGGTVANENKQSPAVRERQSERARYRDECWRRCEWSSLRIQGEPEEGLGKSLLAGKVLRGQVV